MSEAKRNAGDELLVLMQAVDNAGLHNKVSRLTREKLDALDIMIDDNPEVNFEGLGDSEQIILEALVSSIKELGYTDRVAIQVFLIGMERLYVEGSDQHVFNGTWGSMKGADSDF